MRAPLVLGIRSLQAGQRWVSGSRGDGVRKGAQAVQVYAFTTTSNRGTPAERPEAAGHSSLRTSGSDSSLRSSAPANIPGDFKALRDEMLSRSPQTTYDWMSPSHADLLNQLLNSFQPVNSQGSNDNLPRSIKQLSVRDTSLILPETYHFVYFPLQLPKNTQLLPDGTDPFQLPSPTWPRRLWAGGTIRWNKESSLSVGSRSSPALCTETIEDVVLQGDWESGKETILVELRRDYGYWPEGQHDSTLDQNQIAITEWRRLIFLRSAWPLPEVPVQQPLIRTAGSTDPSGEAQTIGLEEGSGILHKRSEAETSSSQQVTTWELTPTRAQLAQYSALSYNAHRIHLDPAATRAFEGHRDTLVQGPLSVTWMTHFLRSLLSPGEHLDSLDYRHIAPLYVEEKARICVRPRKKTRTEAGQPRRVNVWVEGPSGRVHVKATAVVRRSTQGEAV